MFGPLLEVEMSQKCTLLWREAHFQVKMYKAHHVQRIFGSWEVEKVHAVVAPSTFPSQNVQSTTCMDHFWKLRGWKSACRCGAKHMSKSKCTNHDMHGPLLTVQMWFCVAGARDCEPYQKWAKSDGFVPISPTTTNTLHYTTLQYTTLHYNTLHSTPPHHTTLQYTTLRYTTPHYTPLHDTTTHYNTLHYATLHPTTLNSTTLHHTTPHYIALHYTTLHSTTLHSTPLHFTTLHYTTLHYTTLRYTQSSSCGLGDHCNHCNHSNRHKSNHFSVNQWIPSAIRDSQQPTSIAFLLLSIIILKLPPPACVVLLVYVRTATTNTQGLWFTTIPCQATGTSAGDASAGSEGSWGWGESRRSSFLAMAGDTTGTMGVDWVDWVPSGKHTKIVENQHFRWPNQLFLWQFSIANC